MIRRSIATGLGKLSQKMKSDSFIQDMIPILKLLSNDDQDSVRVLCIDSIVLMSKVFTKELNKANIIPILILMIRDKAWKVRIKISNNYTALAEAMGSEITDHSLLNIFSTLLTDPEGEVRLAATQNFTNFIKLVSKTKYGTLIPYCLDLNKDSIPLVRVCSYENTTIIARHLPKEEVKAKLVGTIIANFKTEINNEVKIELLKALTSCGVNLGVEFFTIVTSQDISNFLKEKSWRIRKEVYRMIAEVSSSTKSNQLFEVHFQDFFFTYLTDQVYQVRLFGNSLLPVSSL